MRPLASDLLRRSMLSCRKQKIAASTNSSIVVLLTQGVMYGVGALLVYFPAMFLIDEWFVERKGFAFGISWAGTGIGGASTPFLLQWLLDTRGHRTTLRICAGIIVSLFCSTDLSR